MSLTPRFEDIRNVKPGLLPQQFSLSKIKKHFTDSMRDIKLQYDVADMALNNGNEIACKTIWRSQIVFAESILDFYIHEISKYCLFRMFIGQWKKTEKYKSIMIPIDNVEEAISNVNSNDWFFGYLNNRFSRDVFLSLESMRDQLNLIGVEFKETMNRAFPCVKINDAIRKGSKIVSDLFKRRNEIVHQNDRNHSSAEQRDITKNDVDECISNIESIVTAIHEIVEEKDMKADTNS